ncbi:MAG: hypothetical protein JXA25_00475 [Anaerolineales bacterium]|nr:hypothetical protein [Anaerolineales bacterium]
MKPTRYLLFLPLLLAVLLLSGCDPVVTEIDVACSASSLINAINTANSSPTVTTTLHLDPDCVYELTASVTTDTMLYPAGVGLPEVVSPIIIDGQAATIKRSDAPGTPEFRIFLVAASGDLTINNIFLSGGDVRGANGNGGAVLNHGTLFINTCDVFENHANRGGAVYNTGDFETLWSVYYYNSADFAGGAVQNGSVVMTGGEMTLDRSQFFNNSSYYGGAVHNYNALAYVEGSIFTLNQANIEGMGAGFGGAISNTSGFYPPPFGKMYVYGSTFNENDAAHGGALANMNFSEIAIHDSIFHANTAQYGGAIINEEEMTLIRSAVYDNQALHYGGAIFYHDNDESFGLAITNTTFSGNQITGPSSAADAGSAIYHMNGGLGMQYVTISQNTGAIAYSKTGGSTTIENSIIAENPAADCGGSSIGTVDVLGSNNLDSDGSCPGFTITAPPLLDPLADNGGDTMTHALRVSSPALGNAVGYCPSEDQRDMSRPGGSLCDLGAYESHDYFVGTIPEFPEEPEILATIPVPEEPHKEPDWWWKFEGYVCSESNLTEFFISTDADPELFSLSINERGVKCYQQSYDKTRYWCHVELSMLEWEIPSEISFCVGDICEGIQRTTLSQARCEGDNPPTEPEPQVCSSFETFGNCSAAPGCVWQCTDMASAQLCGCMPEE